ncbi:MAG: rRNA ((1939)-C(5))-methyltransferase RlmD [Pseudomonadota bacterium]|jgi:23S rRNA (uracil1939-C5)-methyltransferase
MSNLPVASNDWSRRPHPGDELTLWFSATTDTGAGLARATLTVPDGSQFPWAAEARHVLPGERARVRVLRARKRRAECELLAIEVASPERVALQCAHAGPYDGAGRGCGGCALAAMAPAAQAALKAARVRALLEQAGVAPEVFEPIAALDPPFRHRNKMEFSFGDDHDRAPALGLHPVGLRYEILDVGDCLLLPAWAMAAAQWARDFRRDRDLPHHEEGRNRGWLRTLVVRIAAATGQWSIDLCTADAEAHVRADGTPIDAEAEVQAWAAHARAAAEAAGLRQPELWWTRHRARRGERTRRTTIALGEASPLREQVRLQGRAPLELEIPPAAFFQPSTAGAELIYGTVREFVGSDATDARVLDLYCGTGSVGLAIADRAAELVGVELEPSAVLAAERNAALNAATNARFYAGDAAKTLVEQGFDQPGRFDLVVVDPPRAGLSPAAVQAVLAIGAPRLLYVSCNPQSLARDLGPLAEAGYVVERVRAVDQFPHSPHVETVAALRRPAPEESPA